VLFNYYVTLILPILNQPPLIITLYHFLHKTTLCCVTLRTNTPNPPRYTAARCKTTILKPNGERGRSKEISFLVYAFSTSTTAVRAKTGFLKRQSRMNSKYIIVNRLSELVPYQHQFIQDILFYYRLLECHLPTHQKPNENILFDIEQKLGVVEWKLS